MTPIQRRDLRLIALFRGVSFLGDSVALIALYLRLAHGGHPWAIAALSVAATLPTVLLAPIAGFVVDNVSAKRLLVWLCGGEALVCVAIGQWHGTVATIVLMALLTGGVAFSFPGYTALVPVITGDEELVRGQSTMQTVQGVASTAGPAVGGVLVGLLGQSWPLYLDALSFALAGLGTWVLATDRRPGSDHVRKGRGERDMGAGMRMIFADKLLSPLMIITVVFLLLLLMINVAEVFFTTRTLHGSSLMYGLVGTSFGAGTIAGAIGAKNLHQSPIRLVRACVVSIVVIGVFIGAIGLVEHVGYMFPLLAVSGTAVGVVNVAFTTLFALRTPEAKRGQVFAAMNALTTSAEIGGTVLGGLALTVIAPRTVFQLAGIIATLSVVVFGPFALRASRRAHRSEQTP
jgi:MFS family permease